MSALPSLVMIWAANPRLAVVAGMFEVTASSVPPLTDM